MTAAACSSTALAAPLRLVRPATVEMLEEHLDCAHRIAWRAARKMAGCLFGGPSACTDIYQHLMTAVIERWSQYDSRRSSVSAFINTIIRSQAASLVRHQLTLKRGRAVRVVGFGPNSDVWQRDARRPAPGDQQRRDLHADVQTVLKTLSPELRQFATLLMRTTVAGATRVMGLTRHTSMAYLDQLRNHFIAAGHVGTTPRKDVAHGRPAR